MNQFILLLHFCTAVPGLDKSLDCHDQRIHYADIETCEERARYFDTTATIPHTYKGDKVISEMALTAPPKCVTDEQQQVLRNTEKRPRAISDVFRSKVQP